MDLVGFCFLVGGFKKSFYFYTDPWGPDGSNLTVAYFLNGLVQPPGSCVVFCLFVWLIGFDWLVGWLVCFTEAGFLKH